MNKFSLLVGNGINCLQPGYSWAELLSELVNKYQIGMDKFDSKPFPLLYEAIYIKAVQNTQCNESEIKQFIANHVIKIRCNAIHQKLMALNTSHILTTNYDLSFESCLHEVSVNSIKNSGEVKESKYSIFRHFDINGKNIWHIHGSANEHQSILLGYEHYSGYLQSMRNYVVSGTGNSYKKAPERLMKRLRTNRVKDEKYVSWIDIFFVEDIHIIGLTLDFCEMDLWWLLTYRERQRSKNEFTINNKIFYYTLKDDKPIHQDKLALLEAMGVEIIFINNTDYDSQYYEKVINYISGKYC